MKDLGNSEIKDMANFSENVSTSQSAYNEVITVPPSENQDVIISESDEDRKNDAIMGDETAHKKRNYHYTIGDNLWSNEYDIKDNYKNFINKFITKYCTINGFTLIVHLQLI